VAGNSPGAAGNRIELWGRVVAEPELRTTPAGTSILRIIVDAGGDLAMAAVMTGPQANSIRPSLRAGSQVRVRGSLKAMRRKMKSGLVDIGYEVMADAIEILKGF